MSTYPETTRSRFFKYPLAALRLVVLLAPAAHALDPHRTMHQYIRDHWSDEQGYPGGEVYAMAQTPDGFLWIGAEHGLVRFDGLKFRLFNDSNTAGFPASPVHSLVVDSEGVLWIHLENCELLRYRHGTFDAMRELAGATAIANGRDDILLIRDDAMRYKGGKWAHIARVPGYSERLAISTAETRDGTVWVGTRDSGLYGLRAGGAFAPDRLRDQKVNCLLSGEGDSLWIGTDQGLFRWDGRKVTGNGVPAPLQHIQLLAMTRDHDGNVWFGTAHGMMRMGPRRDSSEAESGPDESQRVRALFEDREGNLWIGGANGINRYRDSAFLSYSRSIIEPSEDSGPVYVDPAGRTWFGPSSGGLFYVNKGLLSRIKEGGLDRDVVYSIDGGPDELWVGRQRGGLTRLHFEGGSFAITTITASQGLAAGPVYAVHRNRDGTVCAGTLGSGMSCLPGGRLTTYTTADGLASNTISAIEDGADRTMWIATSNGLNSFVQGRWRTYTNQDGVPPGRINSLSEDSAGVLWIGTESGLAFLRNSHIQLARDLPDSLFDDVLGVADDGRGWLWIANSHHVLRVSRAHVLGNLPGIGAVREFGPADGIPAPQGVRRDRSVLKDAEGRIWFSLRRSISVIDPARVGAETVPAIVQIQSVSADGNLLSSGTPLRIPAGRQRIRFDYLALSLAVPDRVRYRYRLDGFDRGWSKPSPLREAVYMNLSPGPYTFRVTASNSEGMWNSREAALGIEVDPAFWQTIWFRALVAGLCAFAMFGAYRMRLHRLMQRLNLRFEERLAERTRIAQELHDTLLQGLVSASMQLYVATGKLPPDAAVRPQFSRIIELMRRVVDESRNAVQELRSSSSDAGNLETAFSKVGTEFGQAEAEFRIVVDGRSRPLNPMIRDEVYRIGREALSNAFRHSGAATIEMEIHYGQTHLSLVVRDNGLGIDEKVLRSGREGHWGLIGMRERAEKIGARLRVWSRITAGTELQLIVPGSIAFPRRQSATKKAWLPGWLRRRPKADKRVQHGR